MMWLIWVLSIAGAAEPPIEIPAYLTAVEGDLEPTPFWETFSDPAMREALQQGLRNNRDLTATWAVVRQVDQMSWQGLAPLMPVASFDVGAQVAPTESLGFQFGDALPIGGTVPGQPEVETDTNDTYWTGNALFSVGMELDWFGRNSLNFKAGRLDHLAAKGDGSAQVLIIASRIADAWFDVGAAHAQLAVVEEQLAAQEALLQAVEIRYSDAGGDAVDFLQQRQQVASTRALVPEARAAVTTARNRLRLLLGQAPSLEAIGPNALPELPASPAMGHPADLMATRPDLLAAEARARAAGVRSTTAALQFMPSLKLSANAGWQGTYFDEFDSQPTWGAGAQVSVPLFSGGRNIAGVGAARASRDEVKARLEGAFLTAVQEVENAATTDRSLMAQLAATREAAQAALIAHDNSKERYLEGHGDYLSVLTSMTAWQRASLDEIRVHRQALGARVLLHQSLGGAWALDRRGGS